MILAGDIGGTHSRLALFMDTANPLSPSIRETFSSREFKSLSEILLRFIALHPKVSRHLEAACFGVPGPVRRDGVVKISNLPWLIKTHDLAQIVGVGRVEVINDLMANAYGVDILPADDVAVIRDGRAEPGGPQALISPGTGLGEAVLLWKEDHYEPLPSEGGHVDFGPLNETQVKLWRYMSKSGHVSYERLISGPGLVSIYDFLRKTRRLKEPAWFAKKMREEDPAGAISHAALNSLYKPCEEALDIFVDILGAETGNLALKTLATGGVFLGGGIVPKILPKIRRDSFIKAFLDKGRLRAVLEDIPIRAILNDDTALLGAARRARALAATAHGNPRAV